MKKGFKSKVFSMMLSICLLIVSLLSTAYADTAETDYDTLTAGAAEHIAENMTDATLVTGNNKGIRVGDTVSGGAGGQIGGNISGFTDYSGGKSVEGKTLVAVAADPEDAANSVLKMTGETATGAASVYSAFDMRQSGGGKSFHPKDASNNLQMWEIKVKMPESQNGELRLFIYGNYYWYSAPRFQNSTQVMVKNGNVYRVGEAYDPSQFGIAYDDLIAENLKAGEWYTFVRVMDMRDTASHKDKIYVFDKDGSKVSVDTEWRSAGKFESYSSRTRLSLGFAGKDFNTGEDVYFDDLRIRYIAQPEMMCEMDGTGTPADTFFAGGNISDPGDVSDVIVKGVAMESFTSENIKLYSGETEIEDGCVISHDGTKGTITLNGLEYDSTYTLAIRNQLGANQWGISVPDKVYTFTIPKDAFVPLSGGVVSGTDGSALLQLPSSGGSIKGQVTMQNGGNKVRKCMVVLCLRDGDRLIAATAKNADVGAGETVPVTTEALVVPEGEITAHVMVWNGWTDSFALGEEYKVE